MRRAGGMAAKDAHTCGSLLFSVLDSALDRRDALHALFCGLNFAMCALYQSWPARSEDRSEVDSGTWQPRAADKTNRCWDWERMGGLKAGRALRSRLVSEQWRAGA